MLRVRLIAAGCIIGPLIFLIWLDDQHNGGYPGIWLGPLAILLGQMACAETISLLRAKQLPYDSLTAHIGVLVVLVMSLAPVAWREYPIDCLLGKPGWAVIGFALAFCIVIVVEMLRYRIPDQSISRIAHTLLVICYTGVMISFLGQLRILSPDRMGLFALLCLMVVVKLSDAGAYFAGRNFGRTKMAPILSPKKTIEGAIGGFLAAWVGAAFMFHFLAPRMLGSQAPQVSWLVCGFFGMSLAAAGIIGDLFESLLKRDAEVKDSSSWLPGLGGVLDVLDSVIAAAPVCFVWFVSGALG